MSGPMRKLRRSRRCWRPPSMPRAWGSTSRGTLPWTRAGHASVLDRYAFDYTRLHNDDIKAGKLRQRFDAIVLPDQRTSAIMDGLDYKTVVPEYRGGLGQSGFDALKQFV